MSPELLEKEEVAIERGVPRTEDGGFKKPEVVAEPTVVQTRRTAAQKLLLLQEFRASLEEPEANAELVEHLDPLIKRAEQELLREQGKEQIEKLKAEIGELNKTVQNQAAVERFGAQFNFNRDETYQFIEKRILENEQKIRALEEAAVLETQSQSSVGEVSPPEAQPLEVKPNEGGDRQPPTVTVEAANSQQENPGEGNKAQAPIEVKAAPAVSTEVNQSQVQVENKTEAPAETRQEAAPAAPKQYRVPVGAVTLFKEFHEEEKAKENKSEKGSKWGYVKERLKGLATFGIWEVVQAERFRRGKKEVGKDIAFAAKDVQKTGNLSLEDALKEAENMKLMEQVEGKGGLSKEDYERYSKIITKEKTKANQELMGNIVQSAMSQIDRRLEKYRNNSGVKVAQLEKNKAAFRGKLAEMLMTLENGQTEADVKVFKNIIKNSFDPQYWHRYVYAGLEAALETTGFIMAAKAAAGASYHGVTVTTGGKEAVGAMGDKIPMNNSIWATAKSYLSQHGISHPTNNQIMQLSKQMAADNHIGVSPWKLVGKVMDTHMQQGHLLKWTKAAAEIAQKIIAHP